LYARASTQKKGSRNAGCPLRLLGERAISAESLGLGPLVSLLEASLDGILVVDENRRYIYANPAACKIFGCSLEELVGRDFVDSSPPGERPGILARWEELMRGEPGLWTATILCPDGDLRTLQYSNMRLMVDDRVCGAAIVRDITDAIRMEREGQALTQIASRVAYGGSLKSTLDDLCRHVVEATGTIAAAVAFAQEEGVRLIGSHGHPQGYIEAINWIIESGAPIATIQAVEERRTIVSPNARLMVLSTPHFAPVHSFVSDAAWDTVVAVPMIYGERAVGVLVGYYPQDKDPGEPEIDFLKAIANQAAVAVENARLLAEVHDKAAQAERGKLARELHDSVTQALFSINLTARTAEIAAERDGPQSESVKKKLADLRQLTAGALAEMRALIFELRPGALEEEGLVQALRKHAAAVQGRNLIQVEVRIWGSDEVPRLMPIAEEALYRIAQEALHNVVKHAKATAVEIAVGVDGDELLLHIRDNGVGFDPAAIRPGHLGLGTMRQRAEALGARFTIESSPGAGTGVTVCVPLAQHALKT
jgi:PAS domain S-box-containing protein